MRAVLFVVFFAALIVAVAAADGYFVMITANAFNHNISFEKAVVAGLGITGLIASGVSSGTSLGKSSK